jgi:hypothetical protein
MRVCAIPHIAIAWHALRSRSRRRFPLSTIRAKLLPTSVSEPVSTRSAPMSSLARAAVAAVFLAAPAAAQGGGFASTDLGLYSPAIQGISSTSGALVLVDLAGGTASILVDTISTLGFQGAAVFDPYRQRMVFCGSVNSVLDPLHLWAANAAGQLDDLGQVGQQFFALAPTGDGRIYLRDATSGAQPFKYIDAAGTLRTLLDATGTAPFNTDGGASQDAHHMIHDVASNALFVASGFGACPAGVTNRINIRKLPLSADGTRVSGPVSCTQFEVSASGEAAVGWSHGPLGQLVLVVDTNAGGSEPRILLVDPATLGVSVFASPGPFFGDPALNAGTWSGSLGQVVVLETLTDVLRAFSAGTSGAGTTLPIVGTVSAAGSSGETASLFAVDASACEGGWLPYGAGLAGAGGFVPTLTGGGCPQIGGAFSLQLAQGVGGAGGLLFIGVSAASLPLKGGTFLVGGVVLQLGLALGGGAGVPGAGSLTLPAALPADPLLQGVQVFLQAGFSDAAAVHDVSLTNGLRMEIG